MLPTIIFINAINETCEYRYRADYSRISGPISQSNHYYEIENLLKLLFPTETSCFVLRTELGCKFEERFSLIMENEHFIMHCLFFRRIVFEIIRKINSK